LIDGLVLKRLQSEVRELIVGAISIGGPGGTSTPAAALLPSVEGSLTRLGEVRSLLDLTELTARENTHRESLQAALAGDSWRWEFPGREILRRFVHKRFERRIDPLVFSNAVLDKMVEQAIEPSSMKAILDKIASQ
jgi:hypothetical protein